MSRVTRLAFVLVLALGLAAPSSWAAGIENPRTAPEVVTRLRNLLTGLWAEAGCIIDPHGGCAAPIQPDEGCIIDPNGGCRGGAAPVQPDAGCIIDPNGGCSPQG